MAKALQKSYEALIKDARDGHFATGRLHEAAGYAAAYRTLFGEQLFRTPEEEQIRTQLQKTFDNALKPGPEGQPPLGAQSISTNDAANFRILFGERGWNDEVQKYFEENLTSGIKELGDQNSWLSDLRILQADELRFAPGKSIEIVKESPTAKEDRNVLGRAITNYKNI